MVTTTASKGACAVSAAHAMHRRRVTNGGRMHQDTGTGPDARPAFRGGALRRAYIGRFIDGGAKLPPRLRNNAEASQHILALSLRDLGGTPVSRSDEETDERLARTLASEVVAAVRRTGGKSAMHWYTDSMARAVAVFGLLHPEVVDDGAARAVAGAGFTRAEDARTVLYCAMAITSQNVPVHENMGYALEQYRSYLATGRFKPKGYGIRGASVKGNLARFNEMLEVFGGDLGSLRRFLEAKFTMRELQAAAGAAGITLGTRELQDETVHGSMVFGPKIGNGFLQNLMGNLDVGALTVDMWMMRLWGRLTGTLVRNEASPAQVARLGESLASFDDWWLDHLGEDVEVPEPGDLSGMDPEELLLLSSGLRTAWNRGRRVLAREGRDNEALYALKTSLAWPNAATAVADALSATVDAPVSSGQRRWIRRVVSRSLDLLARRGYDLAAAELQALVWYPEKALYAALTGRNADLLNTSYDEAIMAIARGEGHAESDIEDALRAHGPHGAGGPGHPGPAGRGLAPGVPGHGEDDGLLAWDPGRGCEADHEALTREDEAIPSSLVPAP